MNDYMARSNWLAAGGDRPCGGLIRLLPVALLVAAATVGATRAAGAAQQADPFDACARETDAAARLACFDQAVKHRHASSPAHEAAGHQPAVDRDARAVPGSRSAADGGASAAGPAAGEPPRAVVAHVTRLVYLPDQRYIFNLDNGQVWEQVESQQGLFVDAHEAVRITPGAFGSYFLQTSKHRLTRVRRLR